MVAFVADGQTRRAPKYAIVGKQNEGGVCHVGLLQEEADIEKDIEVDVYHMRPPLYLGPTDATTPTDMRMPADVVGWVGDVGFTPAEIASIDLWIEKLRTFRVERAPHEGQDRMFPYAIHPAFETIRHADKDKRVAKHRFSCAGFVLRCYFEGAQIPLIEGVSIRWIEGADEPDSVFDASSMPELGVDDIVRIWTAPEAAVRRILRSQGLSQDPPWRLLLPGYLLHACRPDVSLPHKPDKHQCRFDA